jgi:hypothetical protein
MGIVLHQLLATACTQVPCMRHMMSQNVAIDPRIRAKTSAPKTGRA